MSDYQSDYTNLLERIVDAQAQLKELETEIEARDEALALKRNDELTKYQQQYADIQLKIQESQKLLDDLTKQIEQQKLDLLDIARTYVSGLEEKIGQLEKDLDDKNAELLKIQLSTEAKQAERDSILLSFENERKELDAKQQSISDQSRIIAQANADLDTRKIELDSKEKIISQKENDLRIALAKNDDVNSVRETDLKNREDQLVLDSQKYVELHSALDQKDIELNIREKDIQDQLAAALPQIARAKEIEAQEVDLANRKDNFKIQLDQLKHDIAQVQTTLVAQSNKQAELNNREAAVRQAEQKNVKGE